MKHDEIAKRIKKLARDSWAFLNWEDLPKRATKFEMVEALLRDRRWIEDHCSEVCKQIDALRFDIEYGAQPAPECKHDYRITDITGVPRCVKCGRSENHDMAEAMVAEAKAKLSQPALVKPGEEKGGGK